MSIRPIAVGEGFQGFLFFNFLRLGKRIERLSRNTRRTRPDKRTRKGSMERLIDSYVARCKKCVIHRVIACDMRLEQQLCQLWTYKKLLYS